MPPNPYQDFVSAFAKLVREGKSYPLGGFPLVATNRPQPDAPKALFFAPHPDDECIVGAIAVRLMREMDLNVINVAVTQGSKKDRQAERLHELRGACDFIGFGLQTIPPNGLEQVNVRTREQDPAHWSACVTAILNLLKQHEPRIIMFPHEHDWNSTHIGTYWLIMDALKLMPAHFQCYLVETEFWGQMTDPNLMLEVSADDLADMIAATTFHVGEVQRNPYHLLLPAWMMDNVRRGSELVGGQGGTAPDFTFAALYRLRKWSSGQAQRFFKDGKLVSQLDKIDVLFP